MNKSLRIDFTDEGWEKMEQTRALLVEMFGNKLAAVKSAPGLLAHLRWFWNNKHHFRVSYLENSPEEK